WVPGKVVVDDGVEVLLEVDSLGEAVGGDEDALLGLAEREHALLSLCGGKLARDGLYADAFELRAERVGEVVRRRNEAAEDDWVVAVCDELCDQFDAFDELWVARIRECVGFTSQREKAAAIRPLGVVAGFCVGARNDIYALGGLVVDKVEDVAAADLVGF